MHRFFSEAAQSRFFNVEDNPNFAFFRKVYEIIANNESTGIVDLKNAANRALEDLKFDQISLQVLLQFIKEIMLQTDIVPTDRQALMAMTGEITKRIEKKS